MEPKLILVEGLLGSGKTTIAMKEKQRLEERGRNVVFYEGKSTHPADMAWQAYITKDEYHQFVAECLAEWQDSTQPISDDELVRRIEAQCQWEGDRVTIAYRNINFPNDCYRKIAAKLSEKEIYGGRCSFEMFKKLHIQRWSKFAKMMQMRNETVIFESAFLQSQIFELLCFHGKKDEEILDYLVELISTVLFLKPRLIYVMSKNIAATMDETARERRNPENPELDWFAVLERWVRESRYGREHHLAGRSGVLELLCERQRLDYLALRKLGIPITWVSRQ